MMTAQKMAVVESVVTGNDRKVHSTNMHGVEACDKVVSTGLTDKTDTQLTHNEKVNEDLLILSLVPVHNVV